MRFIFATLLSWVLSSLVLPLWAAAPDVIWSGSKLGLHSARLSPEGRYALTATGKDNEEMILWRLSERKAVRRYTSIEFSQDPGERVSFFPKDFSPDGEYFMAVVLHIPTSEHHEPRPSLNVWRMEDSSLYRSFPIENIRTGYQFMAEYDSMHYGFTRDGRSVFGVWGDRYGICPLADGKKLTL